MLDELLMDNPYYRDAYAKVPRLPTNKGGRFQVNIIFDTSMLLSCAQNFVHMSVPYMVTMTSYALYVRVVV